MSIHTSSTVHLEIYIKHHTTGCYYSIFSSYHNFYDRMNMIYGDPCSWLTLCTPSVHVTRHQGIIWGNYILAMCLSSSVAKPICLASLLIPPPPPPPPFPVVVGAILRLYPGRWGALNLVHRPHCLLWVCLGVDRGGGGGGGGGCGSQTRLMPCW